MNRFEENLKLAHYMAHKFSKNKRHEFDDLYQEACVALWEADNDYNDSLKVPFGAFAAQRIQFKFLNYMNTQNFIKTCRNIVILANRIHKGNLEEENVQVLAAKFGVGKKKINEALNHLKRDIASLDYEFTSGNNENPLTFKEVLPLEEDFLHGLEFNKFLDKLKDHERTIFEMIMQGYSHTEIGESIGGSRQSVAQYITRIRKENRTLRYEYTGVY